METLIKDLLAFSQLGRRPISTAEIDMDCAGREVIDELRSAPGNTYRRPS